jgi:outer membrane protein with beta-barrel domain
MIARHDLGLDASCIDGKHAPNAKETTMIDLNGSLIVATVAAFAASAVRLSAQEETLQPPRFTIATYAGASLPTGTLRDSFDNGFLLGAQGNYDFNKHFGMLASFDWTNPDTKLVPSDTRTNVYQGDLGLEVGGARGNTKRWAMRPFVDLGGGVRSYDYSAPNLNSHTTGEGFAGLGTDVNIGRTAIRLAAKDNFFSYEMPTADGTKGTRNDVSLSIGFGFHP